MYFIEQNRIIGLISSDSYVKFKYESVTFIKIQFCLYLSP